MLKKLPIVIAIELLIGLLSFLIAGERSQFGEVAAIFILLSIVCALIFFLYTRLGRAKLT